MTYDEAIAVWKEQNPPPITVHENGEERVITDEEYEAMAADRAQMLMASAEQQAVADADQAEKQSIMDTVKTLDVTANRLDSTEVLTQAQQRHFNAEHMRTTARIMRYLNKHSNNPVPET